MSDIIRQLPDSVANQIAAGEVVRRPASVIKELVENAVDAGASNIKLIIKDAGKTLIQIIDDGIGMSDTDARMAFERHATSKIRNAEDLFSLHTMGFRGEALPSICAISEVEVKTKQADSNLGTHLVISASKVQLQEPCVCDKGTVINVKRLFFNVPARRKFLRSDNVELSNIIKEFERLALVNNNVGFYMDTGNKVINLRPGTFKQRIIELWKSNLDAQLIPININTSLVKIDGFVTRPEFARRRNVLQFLIANGRNMRHPYFHKAVISCYDNLIATDTQPCYFLKFEVDPQSIDVNRSPTKDEIKFEYESQIWPILTATIKAALGKFSAVPSIDFNSDSIPVHPLREGEIPKEPTINFSNSYNPFKNNTGGKSGRNFSQDWEKLYDNFGGIAAMQENSELSPCPHRETGGAEADIKDNLSLFENGIEEEVSPVCIQFSDKYILMPSREGVFLIDQHRAHVKILFEEYILSFKKMDVVSQSIMFPERITLDEMQIAALEEVEDILKKMGFYLEYVEESDWQIACVPSMLKNHDAKDIILKILDSVNENSDNYGEDNPMELSLATQGALLLAKSTAIKGGKKLKIAEMENLVCKLFALDSPAYTPNGNRIFTLIKEDDIIHLLNS